MTDRVHTLNVVLEKDLRIDDCAPLINAIRMMRGVLSVGIEVSNVESHMAEMRARADLGEKIWLVLHPPKDNNK